MSAPNRHPLYELGFREGVEFALRGVALTLLRSVLTRHAPAPIVDTLDRMISSKLAQCACAFDHEIDTYLEVQRWLT